MDPPFSNGLFGSGSKVAIADVYRASLGGLADHRGAPRWISACFPLIAPKALVLTLPIHTSGSTSNGRDPISLSIKCYNVLSDLSLNSRSATLWSWSSAGLMDTF